MAGWADYNLGEGEFLGTLMLDSTAALEAALIERCDRASINYSELTANPKYRTANYPLEESAAIGNYTWTWVFQDIMNDLIVTFVNMDTLMGWTEEELLIAIGDAERIVIPYHDESPNMMKQPLDHLWANQQFKMLNKLMILPEVFTSGFNSATKKKKGEETNPAFPYPTWAEAASNMGSYGATGVGAVSWAFIKTYGGIEPYVTRVVGHKSTITITPSNINETESFDVYCSVVQDDTLKVHDWDVGYNFWKTVVRGADATEDLGELVPDPLVTSGVSEGVGSITHLTYINRVQTFTTCAFDFIEAV